MAAEAFLIEKQSYNALSISLYGDYRKLQALKEQHASWTSAYEKTSKTDKRQEEWTKLLKHHIQLILPDDNEFPTLLAETPWQPHALYVRGAALDNRKMKLAIVGTRKATAAGLETAKKFAQELARAGIAIVSGMALGIDAAAHEGALLANGATIAVLGCGLDTFYPKQNAGLAEKILKNGGTVISEYPLGSPALQQRFLERNRITSGISSGVIVVESPLKSGAQSTARFAIEQNREVLAVPGAISNPNYAGSHQLIRNGATLVTSTDEILEHFHIEKWKTGDLFTNERFDKLEKKHRIILQALQDSGMPLSPDELAQMTQLTVSEISESLTLLTLDGIIKEENGTYFIL